MEVVVGFVIGVAVGLALALPIAYSPTVRSTLYPLIVASQAVPEDRHRARCWSLWLGPRRVAQAR